MSMTTRKCLSVASWGASLLFCGLLLFSAIAAAEHKAAEVVQTQAQSIPTIQARP